MKGEDWKFVVSVLVADRVGILRDITSAVTDLGANIDGISQTVVAGYFTVILTAVFGKDLPAESVRAAVEAAFPAGEASVVVRRFEPAATRRSVPRGDRYVVTVAGHDQRGVLKRITSYLADKGINVEDWYFALDGEAVTHVGEVTVPPILDISQVQSELQQHMRGLGLTVAFQHENIFRVTHEVGAVRSLIGGGAYA